LTEARRTDLGIRIENRNTASRRLMKTVDMGICGLAPMITSCDAAEKNIGAMPRAGNGLLVRMPHGRSRARAAMKSNIAMIRSPRYGSLALDDEFERSMVVGRSRLDEELGGVCSGNIQQIK
jgi:hypothetical protein